MSVFSPLAIISPPRLVLSRVKQCAIVRASGWSSPTLLGGNEGDIELTFEAHTHFKTCQHRERVYVARVKYNAHLLERTRPVRAYSVTVNQFCIINLK